MSPLPSHSQIFSNVTIRAFAHVKSVKGKGLLFPLAADLYHSRGVELSARWDLLTVHHRVWDFPADDFVLNNAGFVLTDYLHWDDHKHPLSH